ncbi:hypothetical protein [Chitinophaga ginsengisoli]|uniref:Uncharacterized protein n=1 Tax=Chitinophaga ginsengisoli TaxID=363837 RepID=A0A2P8G2J3_9BACT|nr:hypothetical protein [Chitinophaga ginsengisoli]PSL28166.1 hypothetical protein CLV42_10885 [Chitinophaga ginsengisoli]
MKKKFFLLQLLSVISGFAFSQHFAVAKSGVFTPQQKKVLLLKDTALNKSLILFKTNLHVNTDGTPLSYHPFDLNGDEKALNNICNAVAVRKDGSNKNLCLSKETYKEALSVFARFRDSGFLKLPTGYSITWENVLVPQMVDGKKVPCVIKSGEYEGYFGSATSLRNGLSSDKGECDCNDQVNPLKIPALVLVGGSNNIVRKFGAKLGDLLIAYNPTNKHLVYAIINDFGPPNNLGEGSVLLNMKLRGDTTFPKKRKDTFKLSISSDIIIAVIPDSRTFQVEKPFTPENITSRVEQWLRECGFQTGQAYIDFLESSVVAKLK